jgi:hypothetical protein
MQRDGNILRHGKMVEVRVLLRHIGNASMYMKLLPSEYGELPTDMLIWEDNIALLTLEEPIFGTVITSPLLAKSYRIIFRALHDRL